MAGLLDVLNDPRMGMAIGLLSGASPGGTFASGAQQGLMNAQSMSQAAIQGSLMKAKLDEIERQKREQDQIAQAMPGLLGYEQNAPADGMGPVRPGAGLLGNPNTAGLGEILKIMPNDMKGQLLGQVALQQMKPLEDRTPADLAALQQFYGPEKGMQIWQQTKMPASTSVNVSLDKPMSVDDISKLRDAQGNMPPVGMSMGEARSNGYTVVRERTPEQASKEQMLKTAQAGFIGIENLLFDKDGKPNRKNIASMDVGGIPGTEGRTLNTLYETGIQAITRGETGAAMPPSEVNNTRKRFQPTSFDNDVSIKVKNEMYKDFINGSLKLINPDATFDVNTFNKELEKRIKLETSGNNKNGTIQRNVTTGNTPEGVDPAIWQNMTEQERALWR